MSVEARNKKQKKSDGAVPSTEQIRPSHIQECRIPSKGEGLLGDTPPHPHRHTTQARVR